MASPDSSSRAELPQQKWYDVKLMEIIPRRGFTFIDDHNILDSGRDAILKWAIETEVPSLEQLEVEEVLAEMMLEINAIANHYATAPGEWVDLDEKVRTKPILAILEDARKELKWSNYVPRDVFADFFQKLFHARSTYNMLTRIRGMPEEDKGMQNDLALAIDEWIGMSPKEDAEAHFAQMPPHKVHRLIDKLLGGDTAAVGLGDGSVMDSDVDMEDGSHEAKDDKGKGVYEGPAEDEEELGDPNAPWIPWTPNSWQTVGDSQPTDENAPWVHHYPQASTEDDDEDVLGATNGFLGLCIHQHRRRLHY